MKMRNGDFEGAVSEFDGLISTAPDSMEATEAAFLRGHALLGAKRPAAAKGAFADYLTRHPDTADAPEALLMRGHAAEKMLDFSAAEADYTKFISDYPRSKLFGEALLSRAELRHQQGQDELAKGDLVMAKSAEGAPSGIRTRASELLERLQGATP